MKAMVNARIYDFDRYIENGYILFDDMIHEVGNMNDFKDENYETIDCLNQLVMPGLVCGHTHIYSAFARGLSLPFTPTNFQEILDQLWWKLDRNIDNHTTYASGIIFGIDHIKSGVTTLIDHHASGIDILGSLTELKRAIVDTIGLRGVFAFETSDRFDVEKCIFENLEFAQANRTEFVSALFGMHASMSLSEKTLKKISEKIKGVPIHIHVAESQMDADDCLRQYGQSIIERLDKWNLISKNSLLVHAIHVQEKDLEIIQKKQAVVCLNVSSNMNNGVGIPDYPAFQAKKIRVILGNDGLNPGMAQEYLNILVATHHLKSSPLAFSLEDLRTLIRSTYEYASTLLSVNLGKIQMGYQADLLMMPYEPPTEMNQKNAMGHLFYGLFHNFKPRHVFIAGKRILSDYQLPHHLEKEYRQASFESMRLWERIKNEEEHS